jgi:transposase-like protein
MIDFPLDGLLDEQACHDFLLKRLHPGGLCCPSGHTADRHAVHKRDRRPIFQFRCRDCQRFFTLFTGTVLDGVRFKCSQIVQILRGIAQATPTAQLAREMGISRRHLLDVRHTLQNLALSACSAQGRRPLPDASVEVDEAYVNAGEKRPSTRRSGRSAAGSREQNPRPRQLAQRPTAGGWRGRTRQR